MPRASGKTTLLIKESAKTGRPIIEPNTASARYVEEQAKEMGLIIPEPISATSWNGGYYRGSNFNRIDGFLIDELDSVLANIFGKPIIKATYTPEKFDVPYLKMNGLKSAELNNVLKEIKNRNEKPIIFGLRNVKENEKMNFRDMMDKYGYDIDGLDICSDGMTIHFSKSVSTNEFMSECEFIMPNEIISNINIIVPNKVVEIAFGDRKTEKMVCHEDDTFDLRKCCFIAIAKHLYKKEYTQEGIEYMATQLTYQKKYTKIVDKALKDYKRKEKEKAEKIRKEEEDRIIRERQSLKRRKQKERRAQRHREALIDVFVTSLNEAKARRKKEKK